MYKIVYRRTLFFLLSGFVLVPGMIALILWGLPLGIDFTGGSLVTLAFPGASPNADEVRDVAKGMQAGEVIVQPSAGNLLTIRLGHLEPAEHEALLAALRQRYGDVREESYETIGPTVGAELRRRAILATTFVLAGIIFYVTWAFRKVSAGPVPSWVYGVATLIALLHDLGIVVGIFAVLGRYAGLVVDSLFLTALLTVLGFSVHDTIVVFDRIRERLRVSAATTFEATVNESINQTIVRSINTSFTAVLVLTALLLFGGANLRPFVLALLIGIVAGTYSSIFIASPLLVVWERMKKKG